MNYQSILIGIQRRAGIMVLALVLFTSSEKEANPKATSESAPEPQGTKTVATKIAITRIDNVRITPTSRPRRVGMRVNVEGTITNPNAEISILVHPVISDTWFVENPPGLPDSLRRNLWRWRSTISCGNREQGLNEDFEIMAIAEVKRSTGATGTSIKAEKLPERIKGLPRSNQVVISRVRN
jgi:hypothetical protein